MLLIDTPVGDVLAIAYEQCLYLVAFADDHELTHKIEKLLINMQATITLGSTAAIVSLQKEFTAYFNGTLQTFTTPLKFFGTPFQTFAWNALQKVPYGTTTSYTQQADIIGKKSAHRAVANANGANQFVIIIPCHRIIRNNGNLGGYGGGINRKQWLLNFENNNRE